MNNKITVFLLSLIVLVILVGCNSDADSSGSAESGEKYELKLSYVQNNEDPLTKGLYKLSENVKERTDGNFIIEVYPNSQLGDTPDVLEQTLTGANVGLLTDAGSLKDYSHEIGILDAPYLYETYEEGVKLVTSDLFDEWSEDLAQNHDVRVASFNWYQGPRHLLTKKEVNVPEDTAGLKIRTPGSTVYQGTLRAMGADPTSLAMNEVYSAVEQGVVDGAEGAHFSTYGAKLYEVINYIAKTNHIQLMTGLVVGETWFKSLPTEYQEILLEESLAAGEYSSNLILSELDEIEQKIIEEGVTVNEVDLELFKNITNAVYEDEGYSELRNEVNAILSE